MAASGGSRRGAELLRSRTTSSAALSYAPEGQLPEALVADILKGNVVCFVGSGFSRASGLPDWQGLLQGVVNAALGEGRISPEDALVINRLGTSSSSHDLDLAAQLLSDQITEKTFDRLVRSQLTATIEDLPEPMLSRLEWIRNIPFCAILTTNFDNLLTGIDPGHASFGEVAAAILREKKTEFQRMQAIAFSNDRTQDINVPVVKLHGDVSDPESRLVLTRRGYRKMLHESTQYSTFLRTLFATKTVLFVGFSFTDAYINELRSEVMAMYGEAPDLTLAYAILNDVSDLQKRGLLEHERLAVLSYDTNAFTDFSGFDDLLRNIYLSTNPTIRFGRLLHHRRVLWLHKDWELSQGTRFLKEFLELANHRFLNHTSLTTTTSMEVVKTAVAAVEYMESAQDLGRPVDCVICCFDGSPGQGDGQHSETLDLLDKLRGTAHLHPVPCLVFGHHTEDRVERTRAVLRKGARCYSSYYYELLSELAFVLEATAE